MRNVAHTLLYAQQGDSRATWVCRGREFEADGVAGMVRFYPADDEEHSLFGRAGRQGMRFAALVIPREDIPALAAADGVERLPEMRLCVWPNDPVLRRCLDRLTAPAPIADDTEGEDRDEAAR